ncbi:hypothetical protein GCM10023231_30080 [Olivibacter ginsenosidimutans]|uniref:alpha-L-rhamnosidase n=1 Tax=Olivibacter ginsenosidimutans TaxID=1176537 RepID=A0ABP9BRT6_9SPHI
MHKILRLILPFLWYTTTLAQTPAVNHSLVPVGLRCDLLAFSDYQSVNGYPVPSQWNKTAFEQTQSVHLLSKMPAFSWEIASKGENIMQQAYRLLVADNPDSLAANKGTIWDSGKIRASASTAVDYKGPALEEQKCYYWKVKVWDTSGEESPYSKPVVFYTGKTLVDYQTVRYPLAKTDTYPKTMRQGTGLVFADFGKDAFGQLKLTLACHTEDDTVLVHFGEALTSDGRINRQPGGTIRYRNYRLPLKQGIHTYQIRFHPDKRNTGSTAVLMPDYIGEVLPFRYIELEGYAGKLTKENVVRSVVNYPFNDEAAFFESSDSVLNKIWELCKYSVKATTFAGVYVDGDRERIPYEADAYINQLCHYAVDKEYSLARYSHEYLIKHATWPTEWILQSVLMATNDYLYTGDLRSARKYYADLKAKTLTALEEANGLISTTTGKQHTDFLRSIHFNGEALKDIVDWPHSGILGLGKDDVGETDGFVFTDYNAVVNAYYYKALRGMAELSKALGYQQEASDYGRKAERVYQVFQKQFFDPKQKIYRDGIGTNHASLHTNMFALAFELVPEKYKSTVLAFVRSRGLACSVYGSQFLMDAIYNADDGDYGLSLLTDTAQRSWYNMIREGSTITMEAWGNQYKPNQDWNHVWGAVPANIIPRKLMGVEPLKPGWDHFQIKPQIGNLQYARIKVPTIKGAIEVDCQQSDSQFFIEAKIPANTKADLWIPAKQVKGKIKVQVNGKQQAANAVNGWIKLLALGSGNYQIAVAN